MNTALWIAQALLAVIFLLSGVPMRPRMCGRRRTFTCSHFVVP